LVSQVPNAYTHPIDPDDSSYINLAVAANADVIVSRDKHLLKLIDPDTAWATEFRQRFPGIEVLEPQDFLVPHEKSE
jgi:predicted nucleic acid-binding protein